MNTRFRTLTYSLFIFFISTAVSLPVLAQKYNLQISTKSEKGAVYTRNGYLGQLAYRGKVDFDRVLNLYVAAENEIFFKIDEEKAKSNNQFIVLPTSENSFEGIAPGMEFLGIKAGQTALVSFGINGIMMSPQVKEEDQSQACANFLKRHNVNPETESPRYSLTGYFVDSRSFGIRKATIQKHHANFVDIKWVLTNTTTKNVVLEKTITGGNYLGTLNFNKAAKSNESNLYSTRNAIIASLKQLLLDETFIAAFGSSVPDSNRQHDALFISSFSNSCKDFSSCSAAAVSIKTSSGHGSGFFISSEGYILTNAHVVGSEPHPLVILSSKISLPAEVIRKDEIRDVALLKLNLNGVSSMAITRDADPEVGSEVFAIGTPEDIGLGQSITKGIISAVREQPVRMIQTDVSINKGNSGGALLNANYEVIGIVTSKIIRLGTEGIGFAVPIDDALESLGIVLE